MVHLLENGVEVNADHAFEFIFEDPRSVGFIQFTFQERLGICQELAIQVIPNDTGQVLQVLNGEGSAWCGDSAYARVQDVDRDPLAERQLVE
jgi:hypothetical protein